jgi:hypothetical protein
MRRMLTASAKILGALFVMFIGFADKVNSAPLPTSQPRAVDFSCQECSAVWSEAFQRYYIEWGAGCEPEDMNPDCAFCNEDPDYVCVGWISEENWCAMEPCGIIDPVASEALALLRSGRADMVGPLLARSPNVVLNEARGAIQIWAPCGSIVASYPLNSQQLASMQTAP